MRRACQGCATFDLIDRCQGPDITPIEREKTDGLIQGELGDMAAFRSVVMGRC